ncbi:MAG: YceI family protein [Phaeodactylibacter sp.]|nr:YceI family protein [Phaeodactylibacter sp.]MCB9291190.1 YceI family protein [Lewinellaceae bacterium]
MQNRRPVRNLLIGLLATVLASSISPTTRPAVLSYRILHASKLFLEGTTNVNTFICKCDCVQSLPTLQFEMDVKKEGQEAIFEEAQLNIRTKDLDCGNRGMNKDLHETLKAGEYPSIGITILEAGLLPDEKLACGEEWAHITTRARLTVAGVGRNVLLRVKARQTSPETYRFQSQYTIKMTDFDIEPPTAMLGLIKVNDEIEIHFDLTVAVEQAG